MTYKVKQSQKFGYRRDPQNNDVLWLFIFCYLSQSAKAIL